MEWNLDKYLDQPDQTAKPRQAGRPAERAARAASLPRSQSDAVRSRQTPQRRRRVGLLPPWLLVLGSLLFYAFFFHVWTENHFSVGRFLTLCVLSVSFALLSSLMGTIGKKRKLHLTFALVTVTVWAVLYLTEYFILDSFKNFYTLEGIFTGAGNAGQEDFSARMFGLVGKNLWRIVLFALPIAAFFLANRYLRLPRILTRGVRRYLALAGGALLLVGLFFAAVISPDHRKMSEEYNFTEAVRGFGLPMGLALESFHSGEHGDEFVIHNDTAVPQTDSEPSGTQSTVPPAQTDEQGQTVPMTTNPPVEPQKPYNKMDIDFDSIIANSNSDRVINVSRYVSSLLPSRTNEMTGLFAGKNLIIITAEGFAKEIIDAERTPTLYRMATQGIQFTDYYQPAWGGSTSTGEFSVLTGIEPAHAVKSITDTIGKNMYLTMGNQLRRLGYFSRAYHNNSYTYYDRDKTHENLGYEKFIGFGNGMEEGVKKVWPASDQEMIDFTVPQYINQQPFSIYYITVSGHGLYSWTGNSMSAKHKEEVQNLPYSDTIKAFFACNIEVELAMRDLLEQLEQAGIADDTVVVLTADHYPYCLEKSDAWNNPQDYLSEVYGFQVNDCFGQDHNALIIWSGCLEGKNLVVDTPTYSLDIVPTLSNLFGVEYDSRLLVGRDVFSDQEPLVLWPNHSWKTDKGSYNASKGTFTPADGVEVPDGYVDRIKEIVRNKINYSDSILNMDYFELLFGN